MDPVVINFAARFLSSVPMLHELKHTHDPYCGDLEAIWFQFHCKSMPVNSKDKQLCWNFNMIAQHLRNECVFNGSICVKRTRYDSVHKPRPQRNCMSTYAFYSYGLNFARPYVSDLRCRYRTFWRWTVTSTFRTHFHFGPQSHCKYHPPGTCLCQDSDLTDEYTYV